MTRLAATVALLALAAPAAADPRWWQSDHLITPDASVKSNPDVALVTIGGRLVAIFVVWEQQTPLGDTDVMVTASFDGGCKFCAPIAWASGTANETGPRVAAGVTAQNMLGFQVVYERAGAVLVAGDASQSLSTTSCARFELLSPPAGTLLSRTPNAIASRPRIAAARRPGYLHFHAVWESTSNTGVPSIHYDADLTGTGSGFGGTAFRDLSSIVGLNATRPDVAADTLASSTASSTATVMFLGPAGDVRMTRSIDSGNSFSTPAETIGAAPAAAPSVDSSTGTTGDGGVWNGAAWGVRDILLDAAFWQLGMPPMRVVSFQTPGDDLVSDPPLTPGSAPSLSISPAGALPDGASAVGVFWQTAATDSEIAYRGGRFRPFTSPNRDLGAAPFVPLRTAPADLASSRVEQLSLCKWSDNWPTFAGVSCNPQTRPAGTSARQVSSDDGLLTAAPLFATVFIDDRSGSPQVWFKMTDGEVAAPAITAATGTCDGLRSAAASLSVTLVPDCARVGASEFMAAHYLYYGAAGANGTTADGPFPDRIDFSAGSFTVPGLLAGETYHFTAIGEDEARNINPQTFDPRVSTNTTGSTTQHASLTTGSCAPQLSLTCTAIGETCMGSSNGAYNPGDTVTVRLDITNGGDWPASGVTNSVMATDATVLGTLAVPNIAAGATATVNLDIQLGPMCPLAPALSVTLQSDAADPRGPVDHGTLTCTGFIPVECSSTCGGGGGCVVPSLTAGRLLLAAKDPAMTPPSMALFDWQAGTNAIEHHLNAVTMKWLIDDSTMPGMVQSKRPPVGVGVPICTAAVTSCLVALGTAEPLVYYQAYEACGPQGTSEGPF